MYGYVQKKMPWFRLGSVEFTDTWVYPPRFLLFSTFTWLKRGRKRGDEIRPKKPFQQ